MKISFEGTIDVIKKEMQEFLRSESKTFFEEQPSSPMLKPKKESPKKEYKNGSILGTEKPTRAQASPPKKEEPEITYDDVRKVVDELPEGKANPRLKQIVINEFDAASLSDVSDARFGELIERVKELQAEYDKEASSPTITRSDVEKRVMAITKDDKGKRVKVIGALKRLKAFGTEGKPKVTALKPENFGQFMAELEKIENA